MAKPDSMMTGDELERSISQYADGTLPAGEWAALEAVLAGDAAAASALGEYRRLDRMLADLPWPAVDWDRLATHLSSVVAAERGADPGAIAGRIGYGRGLSPWRWAAAAAVVLMAMTVGLLARYVRPATPGVAAASLPSETVAVVEGPAVDPAAGPVVDDVVIGPSPALAAEAGSTRYGEGVVSRPATVVIARATPAPGHDLRLR